MLVMVNRRMGKEKPKHTQLISRVVASVALFSVISFESLGCLLKWKTENLRGDILILEGISSHIFEWLYALRTLKFLSPCIPDSKKGRQIETPIVICRIERTPNPIRTNKWNSMKFDLLFTGRHNIRIR